MRRKITILALLLLPSCANLSPEANALLAESAAKLVDAGIDRLGTKNPQK